MNKPSVCPSLAPEFQIRRLCAVISICLLTAGVTNAQTFLSGNISGSLPPSGNPYLATANCTVPAGQTLTLQPGVELLIASNVSVTVNGLIQAVGTPSSRITINAASSTYYWNTISLNYGGGTNIFTYCDFKNATTALSMSVFGGNYVMNTEILNCTFSNCFSQAIYGVAEAHNGNCYAYNATLNPVIENCIFSGMSNGCVFLVYGQNPYNAGVCGLGEGYSNPTIVGNVFQYLTGTAFVMQVGSYAGGGTPTFVNNTLFNCGGGVYATDPWNPIEQDNIFAACTNAVTLSGSLSQQVSYNDFYGNATNFTGYNGNYGSVIWNNRNGTPADVLFNIFQNPLFVSSNNFQLQSNSPCTNAGAPGQAFENICSPPSSGSAFGDMGAYGGPDACNWLTSVPLLPAQASLTESNNLLWLNWEATPRSTYQVLYVTTNLHGASGTNHWLTNTTVTPATTPISISVAPYPATNSQGFYKIQSLGRTPGN